MHGAAWSRMEPPCILQILQEPYGDHLNEVQRCMEPHGATLYTSNSAEAVWKPFK